MLARGDPERLLPIGVHNLRRLRLLLSTPETLEFTPDFSIH